MSQWVEMLGHSAGDLSSVPGTHLEEVDGDWHLKPQHFLQRWEAGMGGLARKLTHKVQGHK